MKTAKMVEDRYPARKPEIITVLIAWRDSSRVVL